MSDLNSYLAEISAETDRALDIHLPPEPEFPVSIHSAARYSVFAGGKRFRPALAIASAEAVGGHSARKTVMPFAAAIEMIHTYTLIHDDLPALDNDDLRRGRPTAHVKFGEAIAILAGDMLLTHAFEVMTTLDNYPAGKADPRVLLDVAADTARRIGSRGTIGGQVVDIESENKPEVTAETLQYIHEKKTAELIIASVRGGAMIAGGSDADVAHLTEFGRETGLAFQIADDILDVVGDTAVIGKPAGSDEKRGKLTYPKLFGLDESRRLALDHANRAKTALEKLGPRQAGVAQLALMADYVVTRVK